MEQRKILLTEGNLDSRKTLRDLISRDPFAEYSFVELSSGHGALQWLRSGRADCMLIASTLPDGSGVDFVSRMKDSAGSNPIPCVLLVPEHDRQYPAEVRLRVSINFCCRASSLPSRFESRSMAPFAREKMRQQSGELRAETDRLRSEMTAQIDELRGTKEEAERASNAKDEFLAMLSHELRTPLTPVLSIVTATLTEGSLSADQRETFQMVQRNIELEARLIDDLLDLTQIVSGRLAVERRPVDIHACIQGALDICQQGFIDRQIAVRTEFSATQPLVAGDSPRLHQVLWNLLKNAAKFTAPGGSVEIETTDEGSNVVVEIRDTGIGIEEERLESIFGTYTANPQAPGTGLGLGLAITRAIVVAHGGDIRAFSSGKNRGSFISCSASGHER
jgi:signal transduction histidine kinase